MARSYQSDHRNNAQHRRSPTYESPLIGVNVDVTPDSILSPPNLKQNIEYYAYCGQYLVPDGVAPDTLYFSTSTNNESVGSDRLNRADNKYGIRQRQYLPINIGSVYKNEYPIVEVKVSTSTETGEKLFIDSSTIHDPYPLYMNEDYIEKNAKIVGNEHNRKSVYFICGKFISMATMEMDDASEVKYKDRKVKKVVCRFENGTITYRPFLPVIHHFLFIEPEPVQPANTPTPTRLERLGKFTGLWGSKNTGGRRYKTKRLKRRKHRKTARRRPKY
jgi:hypothetical protein